MEYLDRRPDLEQPHAQRGLLRPVIDFGHGECVAMIDAVRSIDPQRRLGEEVAYVGRGDMMAIEKALAFVRDLP